MTKEQEEEIFQLHNDGTSYREIEKSTGIPHATAQRAVKRIEAELADESEYDEQIIDEPGYTVPSRNSMKDIDHGFPWIPCIIVIAIIAILAFFIWLFWGKKSN